MGVTVTVGADDVFAATGGQDFDRALPSVVFLHGAGMDQSVWTFAARALAHHGRAVLAPDLPGHGRSGGRAMETIDALAAWVVDLLDAVGIGETALVGHSMGALTALACAARSPERVRSLALLGAAARMPVHPDLLAAAAAGDPLAYGLIVEWGHGSRGRTGDGPVPGLWMAGGTRRLLERNRPGTLHAGLKACDDYTDAMQAVERVRCPTLVIAGSQDRMTPPAGARPLADAIAGARTRVLEGCGHMMMTEAPVAVTEALAEVV